MRAVCGAADFYRPSRCAVLFFGALLRNMRFVVVGAGVAGTGAGVAVFRHTCLDSGAPPAGVCCLRELASRLPPETRDVTLIAPGDNAKARQSGPTLPVSRSHPCPCLARAAQCVENVERVTRKVEIFNGASSERHSRVACTPDCAL